MKQQILKLSNATLELSIHFDGALVIGQLLKGFSTPTELKLAMRRTGFAIGLVENGIAEIAGGSRLQHVIAKATWRFSPPEVEYLIEPPFTNAYLEKACEEYMQSNYSFMKSVQKGEPLLKLLQPGLMQLVHPNGFIKTERVENSQFGIWLDGVNTRFDEASSQVIAEEDGIVSFGVLHETMVQPEIRTNPRDLQQSTPYQHGTYMLDDLAESTYEIYVPGNLKVSGDICLQSLKVDGNLEANFVKSPGVTKELFPIHVDHNVYVKGVLGSSIHSRGKVVIAEELVDSELHVLKSAAVRYVRNSEVNVAQRLYVRDVSGNSHIRLGRSMLVDEGIEELRNFLNANMKMLIVTDLEIMGIREKLDILQNKIKLHLVQIRHSNDNNPKSGLILKRLYEGFLSCLSEMKSKLEVNSVNIDLFEHLTSLLNIYKGDQEADELCELRCYGTLQPGVVISTANQSYTVNRKLQNICVKVNSDLGSFEIISMAEEETASEMENG